MYENRIFAQGTDFLGRLVQAEMVGVWACLLLLVRDVFSDLVIGSFKTPLSVMLGILNIL